MRFAHAQTARLWSNQWRTAVWSAVVRRAGCNKQCNRLREVSQPITWCCDPRLRWNGQRDRNARTGRWVQEWWIFYSIRIAL